MPLTENEENEMNQIIASSRPEAVKFANGGAVRAQRTAYWKSNGRAFRAERCPGERECRIRENFSGWWSATKTVAQKLGI